MGKIKGLVFEQDELEYQDRSKLIAFLSLLANQDSDCTAGNKSHDF